MIKFSATSENGTTLVGLGITPGNIDRLKEGKPILVDLRDVGVPHDIVVMILFGESEAAMENMLREDGLITPETQINEDPRLRDHERPVSGGQERPKSG